MKKRMYLLFNEDEFGYRKIKLFYCTKKQIEKKLFTEYIKLKRKMVKNDQGKKRSYYSDYKKRPREPISTFFNEKRYIEVFRQDIHQREYFVFLNVGFRLYHKLYYMEIEKKKEYVVKVTNNHIFTNDEYKGFYARQEARKVLNKEYIKSLKLSGYSAKNKNSNEKIKKKKILKADMIMRCFDYDYRKLPDYREWDLIKICVSSVKVKKGSKNNEN